MDRELQEEKKKSTEAEGKIFDLLFSLNGSIDNPGIMCAAEGKPCYGSYAHLVEDQGSVEDLLELANEELKNKHLILRKIASKLLENKDLNKEDRPLLLNIVDGFSN